MTEQEDSAGRSFRNLPHVLALPVHEAGVADVLAAASLLISEAALPELVSRAVGRSRQEVAA
jgi:large subunit ribosomal protein L4